MAEKDKRIDLFISNASEFAQPILEHLRSVVHKASPDISETIKWGMPHFEYSGKIVCGMASFKEHCALSFRQATLMKDPHKLLDTGEGKSGMGHLGRIQRLKDLPSDRILIQYIREAIRLIEQGARVPKPNTAPSKEVVVPKAFLALLKKEKAAYTCFKELSHSHKKEYLEWITEAKREETRDKRMKTAVEWLNEDKSLNWKYQKSRKQKAES